MLDKYCNITLDYKLRLRDKMSIQQKQQFLRIEIMDKGYNPELFYQFWQTFGIQLSNATMEDVFSIVSEFQKSCKQNNTEEQDQFGEYVEPLQQHHQSNFYQDMNWDFLVQKHHVSKTDSLGQSKRLKSNFDQKNNPGPIKQRHGDEENYLKLQKSKSSEVKSVQQGQQKKSIVKENEDLLISTQPININNVTFQDVIKDSEQIKRKCLKLQPNILDHHTNVEILISKYREVTEEGKNIINKLWKSTYILFTIKTIGRNKHKSIGISWEVERQPSDFQWLRNTLIRMYPGLVVPPLPYAVRSPDQIKGYQRKLESFLLDCYTCPQLRNSKYFQAFLSYSSLKDFQAFKKASQNTSKPKNLSHILNMEGEIKLFYSDKIDGYAEGLQNFINKTSQHLKNVKSIVKQIDECYSSISTKYKQLSQVFVTMSEESCSFSDQQCYPRLTETYRQISQLVNQHSYFCILQKDFLQTFMYSHFAYEKDRVDNIQNLISKRKSFSLQFAKPKHQNEKGLQQGNTGGSVFGKIVGLFGEKSQSLEVASSDTGTLREQVGFYNSQLMKQSIRCVQGMISSHVNHFSMYGHSRIDNVQQMQKIWSKLLVQLSKLKIY